MASSNQLDCLPYVLFFTFSYERTNEIDKIGGQYYIGLTKYIEAETTQVGGQNPKIALDSREYIQLPS